MSSLPGKENSLDGRVTTRRGAASTVGGRSTVSSSIPTKETTTTKRTTVSSSVRPTVAAAQNAGPIGLSATAQAQAREDKATIEQLKQKVTLLTTQMAEKEEQLNQKITEYSTLQREINKYRRSTRSNNDDAISQMERLVEEKSKLLNENDLLAKKYEDLKTHERELIQKSGELEREIANLTVSLESAVSARASAENFSQTLQSAQTDSSAALSQLHSTKQNEIDQLQQQVAKLTQNGHSLKKEIETVTQEKNKIFDDYAELRSKFSDTEVLAASLSEDIIQLNEEKATLEAQIEQHENDVADIESIKIELQKQISSLKNEINDWEGKYTGVNEEKDELFNQLGELDENFKNLQNSLSMITGERDQLNAQITTLEEQLSTLGDEHDELNDELASLNDRFTQQKENYAVLQSDFDDLRDEKDRLQSKYDSLDTTNGTLRTTIAEKNELIGKLTQEIDSYALQIDDLEMTKKTNDETILEKERCVLQNEAIISGLQVKLDEFDFRAKQDVLQIEQLQNQVKSLQAQLTTTVDDKDVGQQQFIALQNELDNVKASNEKLLLLSQERLDASEQANRQLTAQNNTLQQQLDNVKDEVELVKEDLKIKEAECEDLIQQNDDVTAQLTALEKKYSTLQLDYTKQSQEFNDVNTLSLDLEEEVDILNKNVNELKENNKNLKENNAKLQSNLNEVQVKFASLDETFIALQRTNNTLQSEYNAQTMLLEEKTRLCEVIETDLITAKASIDELNGSIEEKLTKLAKLQQDFCTVSTDKGVYQQESNQFKQQVAELETSLELAKTEIASLKQQHTTYTSDQQNIVTGLKEDIAELESEVKNLKNKNFAITQELHTVQDDLVIEKQQFALLQEDVNRQLEQYDIEIDQSREKKKETESLLKTRSREAAQAQQESIKLNEEKMELFVQFGKVKDELVLLQQELTAKTTELVGLKRIANDVKVLQDKLALSEQAKLSLRTQLTTFESDKIRFKDLENKYLELCKIKDEMQTEKLKLTQEVSNLMNKNNNLLSTIEKQTYAIDQLNNASTKEKQRHDNVTIQCMEYAEQIESANNELRAANEYCNSMNKKYDLMQSKIVEYKDKLKQLTATKLDNESTIERLQREVQDLNSELTMFQRVSNNRRGVGGINSNNIGTGTNNGNDDNGGMTTRRTRRAVGAEALLNTDTNSLNTTISDNTTATIVSSEERRARIQEARNRRNQNALLE